jgi:hypothetical protein
MAVANCCESNKPLPIGTLGHVEDHGMSVKLRRGVAIDGAGGVLLKLRGDELAGRLCRIVATDASLGVAFQRRQLSSDGLAVRFADPVIATNKSCYGDGLWCGKVASQPARFSTDLMDFPSVF